MLLKDNYYKLLKENRLDANNGVYLLSLLPQSDIYRGHFPHKPVCPGACSIETIRECAELLIGQRLRIKTIRQCRFTAVLSPVYASLVDVHVSVNRIEGTEVFSVYSRICDGDTVYVELKGEFGLK